MNITKDMIVKVRDAYIGNKETLQSPDYPETLKDFQTPDETYEKGYEAAMDFLFLVLGINISEPSDITIGQNIINNILIVYYSNLEDLADLESLYDNGVRDECPDETYEAGFNSALSYAFEQFGIVW